MRPRSRTPLLLMIVALGLALGLLLPAAPAQAECIYAVVYVSREQAAPIYVHGPDGCVYPTPWNHVVFLPGHFTHTGLPPGTPNGYFIDIRIPIP